MALDRALQHRALREEVTRLRQAVDRAQVASEIIGTSPPIQRVRELIERIADSDASVLIAGESGTGKELVARALHAEGSRSSGPFVAVNCSALPESLLESELFGSTKGAYTDSRAARPGILVQADQGTLFLDEIGDMPLGLQPKLLRALQERKVRPLGSTSEVSFDCRLLCATNRDLEVEVEQKRFREDLYFRINVVQITLPPLRIRGGDVLPLAQRFIEQFASRARKNVTGLTSGAAAALLGYDWPGNVRELENAIQRAVALTSFEQLTLDDLPEKIRGHQPTGPAGSPGELISLEEAERRHILNVLQAVGNNRSLAAQVLGLDRRTLYRKLERYAGNPPEPPK
jgi:two-component system response regulator HydG